MKDNKGFSFVELLVAVAILGIISLPIASSFALAAKTDAKAVQLSAMNDAADDVMLLIGEIEDGYIHPLRFTPTQIDGVGAVLHGGPQGFRRTRGGQKFRLATHF